MSENAGSRHEISSFRGDFSQLASVMQRSWAENPNQPLLYRDTFLKSAFAYPGMSFELAPAVYSGDELLALVAGLPRRFLYEGRDIKLALNCFLTAASTVKGAGYGLAAWGELASRARSSGFDGTLTPCVEGDPMNTKIEGAAKRCGLTIARVFSVDFVSRFLRPVKDLVSAPPGADVNTFLELANSIADTVQMARLWTPEEARWQCEERHGAVTVQATYDSRRGIISGNIMEVSATTPTKAVLIDDILWGDLTGSEQSELLQTFLRLAASRGAQTASCPLLRYAPVEPLFAAGFRKSTRVVHMYVALWNGQQPHSVTSMYIDVI